MSKITASELPITLDGEERMMRHTLRSATTITRHFGGFQPCLERIRALDLDSFVVVLRAGLGADDKEAKTLADKAYRTGLFALSGPLSTFVVQSANGGRSLDENTTEGEEPKDAGNAD